MKLTVLISLNESSLYDGLTGQSVEWSTLSNFMYILNQGVIERERGGGVPKTLKRNKVEKGRNRNNKYKD